MLFDDVVAAKPTEEIPVADLILEFRQSVVRNRLFDRRAVPIAAQHSHVADGAVFESLDRLQILSSW